MPVFVDHEERRQRILDAAVAVLGDGGFSHFTVRRVGKRLGGSSTLVTHYFPSREQLLKAVMEQTIQDARKASAAFDLIQDDRERLEAVLAYFLPLDEEGRALERARIALAAQREAEPVIDTYLAELEPVMRSLIRRAIEGFVEPTELESVIDLVRIWTGGTVLMATERPETWTPERQRSALEYFTRLLKLPVPAA